MNIDVNPTVILLLIIAFLIATILFLLKRGKISEPKSLHEGFDIEIPGDIERQLYDTGKKRFMLADDSLVETNERVLNLYDLVGLLNSDALIEGFYIYPAIYTANVYQIDYILAVEFKTGNGYTYKYYSLNTNLSTSGMLAGAKIDKMQANKAFEYYKTIIKSVEHVDFTDYKTRPSRFYGKAEFYGYLRRMSLKPLSADISELINYTVIIKGAAIDSSIADQINLYFKNEIPVGYTQTVHIGFTAYLYVKKYDVRTGMAFEIGRPCPPRCGELSY